MTMFDTDGEQPVLHAISESIMTITLNRPDKLNAFTPAMRKGLIHALRTGDEADEVRAIIVTGAGRGFCAGADLSFGADTFDFEARDNPRFGERPGEVGDLTMTIFNCRKPIIAAVNGPAIGVGATMLLPMDVRLATPEARFGFVFSRLGIVPEACSTWFLPRLVGIAQALDWVYSGEIFPATEALTGGLIREVVDAGALLNRAHEIARRYVERTSGLSIALSRQMLWKMLGAAHPKEARRIESLALQWMGKSADAKEGIRAFREKRKAEFTLSTSRGLPDFYPWWSDEA